MYTGGIDQNQGARNTSANSDQYPAPAASRNLGGNSLAKSSSCPSTNVSGKPTSSFAPFSTTVTPSAKADTQSGVPDDSGAPDSDFVPSLTVYSYTTKRLNGKRGTNWGYCVADHNVPNPQTKGKGEGFWAGKRRVDELEKRASAALSDAFAEIDNLSFLEETNHEVAKTYLSNYLDSKLGPGSVKITVNPYTFERKRECSQAWFDALNKQIENRGTLRDD